jgi:beta-lactamase superfamily II metal-dependent hydrolase
LDSEGLVVDFWDVGQGDCSVITLPNRDFIIIDVGPASSPLVEWLSDRGSCKVRAVVLTHNDGDHIGALPALVKLPQVGIDMVYMLADRNIRSDSFRRIMRPVRDAVRQGRFRIS